MKKTVNTVEVRQKLGDLLDQIAGRRDEFIIERRGKPLAAMVPVKKLEQMRRAAELHLMNVLDRDTRRLTQKQVDDMANVAKHRTRRGQQRR